MFLASPNSNIKLCKMLVQPPQICTSSTLAASFVDSSEILSSGVRDYPILYSPSVRFYISWLLLRFSPLFVYIWCFVGFALLIIFCCVFCLSSFFDLCPIPMLTMSLDCPFLIAPSIFSNVHLHLVLYWIHVTNLFSVVCFVFVLSVFGYIEGF